MWIVGAIRGSRQQWAMADGVGVDMSNLAEQKQGGKLRRSAPETQLLRRTRPHRRLPCFILHIATAKQVQFRPRTDSIWGMAGKADESEAQQQQRAPSEEVTVLTTMTVLLSAGGLARTAARHPTSPSQPPTAAPPFRRASRQLPAARHQAVGPPPRKL